MSTLGKILGQKLRYSIDNRHPANAVFLSNEHRRDLAIEVDLYWLTARARYTSEVIDCIEGLEIHRQDDGQPSPLVCRLEYGAHGERYIY